ncbi:MAG: hypothetical protein RLZZ508_909 [Actinomycetota bacterium]|jgi:hypothetical protein
MEIRIGVQNSNREVVLESNLSAADVRKLVDSAIAKPEALVLEDEKGRTVIVPAGVIAYVDIAASDVRKVGF